MADNKFEAKHIAALDFDLSKIYEQFAGLNKETQNAGKQAYQNFKKAAEGTDKYTESTKNAGKQTKNFLDQLTDKVRWTAAFRITNALFSIPRDIYKVIKDTEYAVVEITRILNEASLNAKEYTRDIYDIAIAYGATFDDAVDITKKFAQAGYNSVESLGLMKQALVALNTAELDANQATTGLIAVMKQLGWTNEYALENLDLLIDKVNITADNFAVDSATIIEALQKVAGTASNAGQSLDDMIGIITVLSEATGASGANIGNAYKSIISYIQRGSSLNIFEGLGIEVYADKVKGTLLPIKQILDNLAASWQKWDEATQTSFVGKNTDLIDTLNELNDATGEYQTTLESLNDTAEIGTTLEERTAAQAAAGMHRRNYFIALMNNYNDVQEVTNGLLNAEGYSMAENAKTMDTLEKKVEALKTSVQALLYEAGQAGTLELVKGITDFLTGLMKVTQNIGGINTLLKATIGLLIIIKAQKIGNFVAKLATGIIKLAGDISAFVKLAKEANSVTAAMKATFTGGKAAASGFATAVGGIGIALTALTAVIAIANAIESKRQQQIADGIAQSKEHIKSVNATKESIKELVNQYKELYDSTGGTFDDTQLNTIKGIQDQINGLLGDQADKVDLINSKLAGQEQLYRNISLEAAKAARQGLSVAVNKAAQALESSMSSLWTGKWQTRLKSGLQMTSLAGVSQEERAAAGGLIGYLDEQGSIESAADIYGLYTKLINAQKKLYNSFGENATQLSAQSSLYQMLQARINDVTDVANTYAASMQAEANNEAYINYQAKIAKGFEDTKGAVLAFYSEIENRRSGYTEFEIKAMQKLLEETYPEYFTVVKDGYNEIIDTQSKFNDLVKETKASLKDLTGAYQTLVGAVEEYNTSGTISLETLDSLLSLSPEYIMLLADENGQIELSADAYENKFRAMMTVLQAQKLDELTAWIKGLTAEQIAVEGLGEAYKGLGESMLEGKLSALGNALSEKVSAGILSVEQAIQLANSIKNYFSMFDSVTLSSGGDANTTKDLVAEAERQIDWLRFYAEDSAQKQLEIYEDLLEKQTAMDEDRLNTLRKIAQLKMQIAEDEADAAIAAKKKEWDEIDREEEYREKRKELQDELAYWSVRGTSEASRKRSEITDRLADLESEKQREDARAAALAAIEAARDVQIAEIISKYGQLEQDIMANMLTEAEREAVSGGMENLSNINDLMGDILSALNAIKDKPAPEINITVEGNTNASGNTQGGDNSSSTDLANSIVKGVRRALEGYYTQ